MVTILPQNILLVDKPKGITSFDCIRILRKKLNIRKMGHAGTLDPMATGLMIIGVGDGTKKLHEFLKLDKAYEAEILLGVKTDTGDITGKILEELPISNSQFSNNDSISKISNEEMEKILQTMIGKLELPVPAYSAIKRGGEALYKKARRGEVVDTPIKTMEITSVEFLGLKILPLKKGGDPKGEGFPPLPPPLLPEEVPSLRGGEVLKEGIEGWLKSSASEDGGTSFNKGGISLPIISARFDVTSGTYIRSLAEEFGRRLGVPATLAGLRRTRIGEYKVEDAEGLK